MPPRAASRRRPRSPRPGALRYHGAPDEPAPARVEPAPMRIVSLLPSATEIVCALGLEESLVGVTHECDFPPGVRDRPAVTRTRIPADASSAEIDRLVREQLREKAALYTLDR